MSVKIMLLTPLVVYSSSCKTDGDVYNLSHELKAGFDKRKVVENFPTKPCPECSQRREKYQHKVKGLDKIGTESHPNA